MLDGITLKKLTEYYQGLLNILDGHPISMEDFRTALQVDETASSKNVLRELSPEEAGLLFVDISVFRAAAAKRQDFIARGYTKYVDAPGGLLLTMLEQHIGAAGRLLIIAAGMEFWQDVRLRDQKRNVRVEIVDNVRYFSHI